MSSQNYKYDDCQLDKCLGLKDIVFFGTGKMVGAGIFVLVGSCAEHAGPAMCISYAVAGLTAFLSGLCYCEVTAKVPRAGGAYSFTYISFGEVPAFMVAWMLLFTYVFGAAALCRAWVAYFLILISRLAELPILRGVIQEVPKWMYAIDVIPDLRLNLLAVLFLSLMVIIVVQGMKGSSMINMCVTTVKLAALVCAIVVAFVYVDAPGTWGKSGFAPHGFHGVMSGAVVVYYAYIGFDALATMGEEVKNPQKNIPLGIGISIGIAVSLYILVAISVSLMLPYELFMNDSAPLAHAFWVKGLHWVATLISFAACVGLVSGVMLNLSSQARLWMSLARDGLLPHFLSQVHPSTRTPVFATIFGGGLAIVLAAFVSFHVLVASVAIGALVALSSANLCLIAMRYAEARTPIPSYSLVGYMIGVTALVSTLKLIYAERSADEPGWTLWHWLGCIGILCIGAIGAIGFAFHIARWMPQPTDSKTFTVPGAAVVALLGITVNIFMFCHATFSTHSVMAWVVLGGCFYCFYGYWNSTLSSRSDAFETTSLRNAP